MRDYRYDHVHLRSPDPDATAAVCLIAIASQDLVLHRYPTPEAPRTSKRRGENALCYWRLPSPKRRRNGGRHEFAPDSPLPVPLLQKGLPLRANSILSG